MIKTGAPYYSDQPVNIVGSSTFGRYPKMSSEKTYNMIVSDGWLVPFGGYEVVSVINNRGQGRGIFSSQKLSLMFTVTDNNIWKFDTNLTRSVIGRMETFSGDVFISENNANQIIFSDLSNLYVWNAITDSFVTLTSEQLGFVPGYITFQDQRFVCADLATNQWRLSAPSNGLSWPFDAQHVGEISTKATRCLAPIRFPGKGNLLTVLGSNVGEYFTDIGSQLFPYQRSQSVNIDYGLLNMASLDGNDNMVCWLGVNEKSGPAIMTSDGVRVERISTDGIDFEMQRLKNPQACYGFMMKIDGHLCYVMTFYDPSDNISYLYDFNTKMFFNLCDENMDAFIIKRITFFNNKYYFVSIRDGNLYEFSPDFFDYVYADSVKEIPLIRVTDSIRSKGQENFTCGYMGFTVQNGDFNTQINATNKIPRIDLTLSKDGGVNFGNASSKPMFPIGRRQNKLMWRGLGMANDLTPQFRFHGLTGRFIANNGVAGVKA